MKFPYERYEVEPSDLLPEGVLYRPELLVQVIGPTGNALLFMLVDSGADHTILPSGVANAIGISLNDRPAIVVAGFTGDRLSVIPAKVEMKLLDVAQSIKWTASVGFAEFPDSEHSQAIFGHAGCLDLFRVTLDGERHELELRPSSTFPGTVTG